MRVSTVATFASNWLLPRLPAFQRAHPDLELAVLTTMRAVDLDREDFDCAIRHGKGEWEGLDSRLLFRETLVPVARPDLALGPSERWPIICARTRPADWSIWRRANAGPRDGPQAGVTVENRAQALEAALAGAGVAITDSRYVADLLSAGRLRALGPAIALEDGYFFVRGPHARNPRYVDRLEDWLALQAAGA